MSLKDHSRWVYFLPSVHLAACLVSLVGNVIPSLQYLGIVFPYVMMADFPISVLSYAIGWKHSDLATLWIVVAGTLWWFLLSLGAEVLFYLFCKPAGKSGMS